MFVSALCVTAKKQKRVIIRGTESSDKFAFRCFLLKLGFIGTEYKQARSILLSRLTGNDKKPALSFAGTDESPVLAKVED
ncbi:hypothetical protein AGMMS49975_00770 [Clostridia bacterium]|nr:hypothetical protein AGMMS49975_00770 [Clostridia bacterium]